MYRIVCRFSKTCNSGNGDQQMKRTNGHGAMNEQNAFVNENFKHRAGSDVCAGIGEFQISDGREATTSTDEQHVYIEMS